MRPASLLSSLLLVSACSGSPPRDPKDGEAKAGEPASAAVAAAPAGLPPLNTASADDMVEALAAVSRERAATIAAVGLAELEVGRLPQFLIEALEASGLAAPDQRAMLIARALDSVPGQLAWIQACRGGLQAFEDLAAVAAGERSALLWRECGLADLRLADEATIAAAEPTMVMLALVAFDHLRRNGEVAAQERTILRAMLTPPEAG